MTSIAFPASQIPAAVMPMLWRDRIPAATLTIIAGRPGLGKSTLGTTIAAELSQRFLSVLVSNLEDDLSAVVRPRLEVAGAELDRVHLMPPDQSLLLPRDLQQLRDVVIETQASCVILDPLAAHFEPEKKVHDRPTLRQVIQLARESRAAIVGIHHTTKAHAGPAINSIGGPAGGLAGSARAVYLYGYDPDDEDRRALACERDGGGCVIGRVYTWREAAWRVVTRWRGEGPRNVLIERVGRCGRDWTPSCRHCGCYGSRRERVVRPFRGLRRLAA